MAAPITAEPQAVPPKPRPEPPPAPLENGDVLTREEFERRYDAMPELKKAELIEGVVYMPSPVRIRHHGRPHFHFMGWLAAYQAATPGVDGADNTTVRLDMDNDPQPDGLLFIDPARGGQAQIDDDGYLNGAPELAGEIASSSVSYDLHAKFRVYRRNGVKEYIVWRVLDRAIDWFILRQSQYDRLAPDAAGICKSEVFPGLWLDPAALIAGDLAKVHQVLQQGIASPEHAAFVTRFQQASTPKPGGATG
jgi:Uma2 family endonuclease